jgi:hypothetical protein
MRVCKNSTSDTLRPQHLTFDAELAPSLPNRECFISFFFTLFFRVFVPKAKTDHFTIFGRHEGLLPSLSLYIKKYIYIHLLFKTLSQHAQESRLFLHTGRCEHWPTKVMRRRRATIIECLHEVPTFKCLTLVVRRPLPTKASVWNRPRRNYLSLLILNILQY